jgi:23S rRNA pseudouridine1911/1915/1917 synthase
MRNIEIIFEDSDIILVNKPAGIYVHPSPGHEDGSLSQILTSLRPEMLNVGSSDRPGVVHRLDNETSGIMIFAKSKRAYTALRTAFESHANIEKTYLAILHGPLNPKCGTIEKMIGRKPWDPKRMAVDAVKAKYAYTSWTTLAKKDSLVLVEFKIRTGRTHQIRVHSSYMNCPIVGDKLYGNQKKDAALRIKPNRQLLHAVSLSFKHPITGKQMNFSCRPPDDIIYAV